MDTVLIRDLVQRQEVEIKTGPFGTQLKASEYVEEGTPVLNVRNLGFSTVNTEKLEMVGDETLERLSAHKLHTGDIVFGRKGAVERHAYISKNEDGWMQGSDCIRLRVKTESINARYLSYYFLTPQHRAFMISMCSHGTTMASLNQKIIEMISVPLPERKIQDQIVAVLKALDEKAKNNREINDNLQQQMQLLYQHLLENNECDLIRLEDVSQKIAMGPFGSNIKVSTFVPEGVPIISGNHLRSVFLEEPSYNFITEEHAQKLKNSVVFPRDIVFTHAGNIGQVAMIPEGCDYPYYMISQRQFYMRCDESKVIPEFVLFFFHSRDGRGKLLANANSTGVPSIAQPSTHLKNIEMPMPSKEVQDEWYKVIRPMVKEYVALSQENKQLVAIRDSLLPRLMSGEIDVSNIQL